LTTFHVAFSCEIFYHPSNKHKGYTIKCENVWDEGGPNVETQLPNLMDDGQNALDLPQLIFSILLYLCLPVKYHKQIPCNQLIHFCRTKETRR
jgi:hypothetical protein